jgi:hypothetical protein
MYIESFAANNNEVTKLMFEQELILLIASEL